MTLDNNLRVIELIDCYGKLLTNKQYDIMTNYYFDNLSLSEIGDNFGISRQAVSDCINKSIKILENFEDKLNIISLHSDVSSKIEIVKEMLTNDNLIDKLDEVLQLLK